MYHTSTFFPLSSGAVPLASSSVFFPSKLPLSSSSSSDSSASSLKASSPPIPSFEKSMPPKSRSEEIFFSSSSSSSTHLSQSTFRKGNLLDAVFNSCFHHFFSCF
eukprot:TRINITY_DN5066_c0_g1_i1.p1 TRINITY_DN5066_c0_g1~~TRINITY_DN5066_c0_g1_i1.p1  ORF type:complete len:105 (+),score=20.90 TRINITY_DN5066_c0_g1_i1:209-523(+)